MHTLWLFSLTWLKFNCCFSFISAEHLSISTRGMWENKKKFLLLAQTVEKTLLSCQLLCKSCLISGPGTNTKTKPNRLIMWFTRNSTEGCAASVQWGRSNTTQDSWEWLSADKGIYHNCSSHQAVDQPHYKRTRAAEFDNETEEMSSSSCILGQIWCNLLLLPVQNSLLLCGKVYFCH